MSIAFLFFLNQTVQEGVNSIPIIPTPSGRFPRDNHCYFLDSFMHIQECRHVFSQMGS